MYKLPLSSIALMHDKEISMNNDHASIYVCVCVATTKISS